MAATRPAHAYGSTASSGPRSGVARGLSRATCLALSLACAAGGLFIAQAHPIAPTVAVGLFVAWTLFAFLRFAIALPAMLALVPVVSFATYTGWLTFEEVDLLILASGAGGYAARALRAVAPVSRDRSSLSILSIVLIALFMTSLVVSLGRGIVASGGLDFGWYRGYDEALNSLRIFKSFAWAILLTPLLLDEVRSPGGLDRFGAGLTIALGLGSLAVIDERFAFTGLLDFSNDYRVTGSFWEMHVGGAALDGFLALTIPFAAREAARSGGGAHGRWWSQGRFVAACIVLAMAAYSSLVTFSRGVYFAVPFALLVLVILGSRQHLRLGRRDAWRTMGKGIVFTVLIAISAFVVFRGGGYRAILAVLGVLAIAIPVQTSIRRCGPAVWLAAVTAAVVLGAAGHLVAGILPKGPYVVFAIAFAAALAAVLQSVRRPTDAIVLAAIASWVWLAICACLVALHWGGTRAFADSAWVLMAWVVLSFGASGFAKPLWPQAPHQQLATIGLAALVMGAVAVFTAGAYMGGRFATTSSDLDTRTSHWKEGLARLRGTEAWLLGEGLGRFPASSLFDSPAAQAPGNYRLTHRDGETYVALSGPKLRYLGFGEMFRFSQRVPVRPDTTYQLMIRARSLSNNPFHTEICEKQLLYTSACVDVDPKFTVDPGAWQSFSLPLRSGAIGASPWYQRRPVFFAIAVGNPGDILDIASVRMIGPDGIDLLANGDFINGTARWFSSSDKYHLPWHIKNIALAVLFDQGVVGLVLFALMVGGALLRTTIGRAYRHPDAPYVAAAIAGYLAVGAADSLLDVPRVAFLFYLVTLLALMLRTPRVAMAGEAVARPTVEAAVDDAAAARTKRRQEAFGRRGPVSS